MKKPLSGLLMIALALMMGEATAAMVSKNPVSTNRLAKEKSPYLLQHAANPVDWYAWGPEAFEKARREDKLIFLSIGYSTCHWCHVMEHESFENKEIARLLSENFVAIKVDREERPDIDHIYMNAVQAMTGSGGWPLTVFLTPDGRPFTGGTYFPPEDRWGRPGMKTLLPRVAAMWKEKRGEVEKAGEQFASLLKEKIPAITLTPSVDLLQKATTQFDSQFDPNHGGFGHAPKFPRSHDLSFLLRTWKRTGERHALEMVEVTLDHMARGGIVDPLGGGFHRYATDAVWLVPHFEKMLYDQALLAKTYLEAAWATGNEFYAETARDIFRYVLRDMTDPGGGFYSAEDADSEGEEGKFYVWRPEEIVRVLGPETGRLFNEFYGITDAGNFEHARSILHVEVPLKIFAKSRSLNPGDLKKTLADARQKLFEVRKKRIPPHKDDKILTAWNGLMISSLALGAQVLGDPSLSDAASRSADFILKHMQKKERLLRRFRDGEAAVPAFQEDYAFFGLGLLDLYEATFDIRWLEEAKRLTDEMIRLFWDEANGGFFYTGQDAEPLIVRSKEYYDGATPSGNSVAALLMLRMAHMTGDSSLETRAETLVGSTAAMLTQYPVGYPQLLMAVDFALGPSREIVIAGNDGSADFKKMLAVVRRQFDPNRVLVHHPEGAEAKRIERLADYLKNQPAQNGKTTVYVCRNHVCDLPVTDLAGLEKLLADKK